MVIKSVLKRDGSTIVDYNREFITKAIEKACLSVYPHADDSIKSQCSSLADQYSGIVEKLIKERSHSDDVIESLPIEEIQNTVEEVLVRHCANFQIAKNYIVYRHEREVMRDDIASMVDAEKVMNGYLKQEDWRVNENASVNYSVGGLILHNSGTISSNFWLNEVYTKTIRDAHINADIHLHDLCMLASYCSGWSLHKLIEEGFGGVEGKISSKPANHLSTLVNQMINFLGVLQNEWAGAQAFSSVDTYLAPFVRHDNLSYKEVKQNIQSLLFGLNISSRWGSQAPFSNFTFDLVAPRDLAQHPVIIGGKMQDTTYGEYQKEMDMINKAFLELYIEGDADGRAFAYPIPTYNLTNDFDWDSENATLLFKMAGKYGVPYFQNFINSDLDPSQVRSMCPLTEDTKILVRKKEDGEIVNAALRTIVYHVKERNFEFEVWTGKKWATAKPNKQDPTEVFEIVTSNNKFIRMGKNHLQPVKGPSGLVVKKAEELTPNDWIPFNRIEVGDESFDNECKLRQSDHSMIAYQEDNDYRYYQISAIRPIENDQPLYCLEVDDESSFFALSNGAITHNCRLRLDKRELLSRGGGLFGANEFTGSIGVVTLNLPRLGYLTIKECKERMYNGDQHVKWKDIFYTRLTELMDIARDSLEIKRKTIDKLTRSGLFPYTKRYLNGDWSHHFSTIGILGMNECCLNINGNDMSHPDSIAFAKEVLTFMRDRIATYQVETGNLYNLEATPGEGTSYRFAKIDKKQFPDIITSGETDPYYTNSTQLPVDFAGNDIFDAFDLQDQLQTLYTGGTVHHVMIGESIDDPTTVKSLVKGIAYNYRLPYFTLSPVYSVCKNHGYLRGEVAKCPTCGETTEVYARIVGYYRKVHGTWNKGKLSEFKERCEVTEDQLNNTVKRIRELDAVSEVA